MLGAPSGSWLCLEILTVTVMKRACDEGQPISRYPILPKHLQQPKIHSWMTSSSPKPHKEWFLSHEPSCILQRIKIKCFRTRTKTIILFLNLRLAQQADSHLQYPGIDLLKVGAVIVLVMYYLLYKYIRHTLEYLCALIPLLIAILCNAHTCLKHPDVDNIWCWNSSCNKHALQLKVCSRSSHGQLKFSCDNQNTLNSFKDSNIQFDSIQVIYIALFTG